MGGRYGKPGSRTTLPYEVRRQYTDACERGSHYRCSNRLTTCPCRCHKEAGHDEFKRVVS